MSAKLQVGRAQTYSANAVSNALAPELCLVLKCCVWCIGQGATVGGVWVYTDQIEDDTLGTDSSRRRVHTSMYANLRTNLPREVRVTEGCVTPVPEPFALLHRTRMARLGRRGRNEVTFFEAVHRGLS